MVKSNKQRWEIGCTVRVGFLHLLVTEKVPTPGDYKPDAYILRNQAGTKTYRFVPHYGLEKIEEES